MFEKRAIIWIVRVSPGFLRASKSTARDESRTRTRFEVGKALSVGSAEVKLHSSSAGVAAGVDDDGLPPIRSTRAEDEGAFWLEIIGDADLELAEINEANGSTGGGEVGFVACGITGAGVDD